MSETLLVIGETRDGELRNVTFEAIAAAKQVKTDGEVVGVLCGDSGLASLAEEMVHYGADRVVTVEHADLKEYTSEGYSQAILSVIEDVSPDGIIMGHTSIGKDVTPKIASKLDMGLVSDAVEIETDGDDVVFTIQTHSRKEYKKNKVFNGTIYTTISHNNYPITKKDASRI